MSLLKINLCVFAVHVNDEFGHYLGGLGSGNTIFEKLKIADEQNIPLVILTT